MAKTKEVTVTWVQKQQFVGTDSSKHSVVISSQSEENGTGMSPSQLLLLSLASCSAYDVVNILEKKRQKLSDLVVKVAGVNAPEPPWPYTHITMEYQVRGTGLKEKAVADAIHLSHTRYCSVAATLRPAVEIVTSYEIIEDS
ncbi:MAG: OsmC family protein [Chloroflexota bacterium]|nr:OsmC family protein [Chloroflexota bacterium]